MRVVFMGTPDFAVPSLSELLANGFDVVRVYTQPPRRAGRGKRLTKSPVHQFAEVMGIPVETPERFRQSSVIDELEDLNADVACVVAYGQILPQRALDAPRLGCLNLHGSLLPRWRGAAPVQRAIMAGDTQTGVQIMQMAKGLDTGDILLSEAEDIRPTDTTDTLSQRLSQIGAQMWPRVLGAVERDALRPTPQVGDATYAHKIDKSEAQLDWSLSAREIECLVRGLSPYPGAWCEIQGSDEKPQRVKVHLAQVENASGKAGTVLDDGLLIACGIDAVRLLSVQPAGKSRMSAEDYLRGTSVRAGSTLE